MVSRAIACTIFTLAYTWRIFVVLGIHFLIVLGFKLRLEERSFIPPRPHGRCSCFFSTMRPYFYVFLGTIASTLVYFRLERPSVVKKQLSRRHSTVVIQVSQLSLSSCCYIFLDPACTLLNSLHLLLETRRRLTVSFFLLLFYWSRRTATCCSAAFLLHHAPTKVTSMQVIFVIFVGFELIVLYRPS